MKDLDFSARAEAWITQHSEEIARELAGFVAIRSVSMASAATPGAPFGPEMRRMLDYALMRGAASGFQVKNANGYYGLVSYGDNDHSLGIIAHLDVVPEGVNWLYPPYEAVRQGDFLIGRGANDNKSAAVVGLFVMRLLKELAVPVRHGVRLILGVSEETGMQDMPAYNEREKPCALTLVADGAFPVNYAQKGSMTAHVRLPSGIEILDFSGGEVDNMVPPRAEALIEADPEYAREALSAAGYGEPDYVVMPECGCARVIANGRAAHAADPEMGKSAVNMLAAALSASGLLTGDSQKAICAVAELTGDHFGRHVGIDAEDADTGKTTMVVGVARTREGQIELHVDCRLSVAADIGQTVDAFKRAMASRGFTLTHIASTRPVFISKDDPRVTALQKIYAETTGDISEPYTMGGGTYSRCLPDAITFGLGFRSHERPEGLPEGHGGAHMPDEFVHLPTLRKALLIYARALAALDAIVE